MVVIEIAMLIAGLWAMATAKLPSWLLGGSRWKYEGKNVHWVAVIAVLMALFVASL
jgi:hypothetical protein